MGKKKKQAPKAAAPGSGQAGRADAGGAEGALPRVPERISSPFKDALSGLKRELDQKAKEAEKQAQEKKKRAPPVPPPVSRPVKRSSSSSSSKGFPEDDAMALSLAMQGVKPLSDKGPARVSVNSPKLQSRTAQAVPFGESAEDQARARLAALVAQDVRFRMERDRDFVCGSRIDVDPRVERELRRRSRAADTLDLHGMTQREGAEAVGSFVRRSHAKGLDVLCIVHGKGHHSDAGLGVLRDVVVMTLTETGIAPLVRAFVTAPEVFGGSGALFVELQGRR